MSKANSAVAGAAAGASVGGPWGAVAGGVGGYLMGSDDQSADTLSGALKDASRMPLPVLKQYYPELYQQIVALNPDIETAVNLGPSQTQGISTDPAMRQAQLNALSKLQSIGEAGGRDAQFLSDNSRIENDVNTNLQGQQGAIEQNMATRGMSGAGSELVAKSLAAQGASNRQAQMSMDANAQAQSRALSALSQSGTLGSQMQSQDFNQQATKANAADAISRFNASNQQQVLNNNVNTNNNAQQWNAQSAQSTHNSNVDASNASQKYNLGISQQQYNNQLAKSGIVNTATTAVANNQAATSASNNQFMGNVISAGSTAYAANKKNEPPGST